MATTIIEQLRRAIRDSGKTDYRIAKDAGIGPEQVGRFLAGSDIRISTAAKICATLDLELSLKANSVKGKRSHGDKG